MALVNATESPWEALWLFLFDLKAIKYDPCEFEKKKKVEYLGGIPYIQYKVNSYSGVKYILHL